ncbi:MAG: hypothetical protein ACHREM_31060 [Polyangiales bacterium]
MIPPIDLEAIVPLKDEDPIELTASIVADDDALAEMVVRFAATIETRDISEVNRFVEHIETQVDEAGSESLARALALLEGHAEEQLVAVAQWAFAAGVKAAGGSS